MRRGILSKRLVSVALVVVLVTAVLLVAEASLSGPAFALEALGGVSGFLAGSGLAYLFSRSSVGWGKKSAIGLLILIPVLRVLRLFFVFELRPGLSFFTGTSLSTLELFGVGLLFGMVGVGLWGLVNRGPGGRKE